MAAPASSHGPSEDSGCLQERKIAAEMMLVDCLTDDQGISSSNPV
uniref:Zinc finger protein 426 n=1 Tax=Mus musculus TaxID=10090 RepID=E9Q9D9_MOUSE